MIEKYKALEAKYERLQGHVAGEYEEAMQELDKYGIPRADGDGPTFTLRGRILRFLVRMTSNAGVKAAAEGSPATEGSEP